MDIWAVWLKGTHLSWMITHYAWVWAACEVLHFIGMSFLFGCVGLLDLRLLGIWAQAGVAGINRIVPWGVAGFSVNALTGAIFFIGQPLQYIHNPAFGIKMLLIFLAGWNIATYYLTGMADRVEVLEPEDDAPFGAKVIAGVSLVLWVGVMFFGRMLPFLGNSF